MSFTKKTAETTQEDLKKRAAKVFDNVCPTRISNISCIIAVESQKAVKEFEDKDRDILIKNLKSAYEEDIIKIIEGCMLSDYIDTIISVPLKSGPVKY